MAQYFICSFLIFLLMTTATAGEVYRWVDNDGNVQYSYTRPDNNYTTLDEFGLKISEYQESEESSANINASTEKAAEEKSVEKASEEADDDEKRDDMLLSSYLNTDELAAAYQQKNQDVSDQISLYELTLEKLQERLDEAREQLNISHDASMQQKLKDYISNSEEVKTAYQQNILKQKERIAEMDVQFVADKKRLLELLAAKAAEKKKAD